ncbi:hypothetical protein IAR55_000926 [Kwoniella newhampshirensis]|uniref:Myb-like domain-containing protein n=1 Tax=Kwoniella newhampshirensis TaxID=1651941 RepID=A0AAW0Z487_9TREE
MSPQAIKRSRSFSPTPPPTTPNKSKSTPTKKDKISASSSPNRSASGSAWTNDRKAILVNRCTQTAYKHMDWAKLVAETGMTEDQCKNQLTPGRSNIRKTVSELFGK